MTKSLRGHLGGWAIHHEDTKTQRTYPFFLRLRVFVVDLLFLF